MRNYVLISLAAHLAGALLFGVVSVVMRQPLQPAEMIRVDLVSLPQPVAKTVKRPKKISRPKPEEKPKVEKPNLIPPVPPPVETVHPRAEIDETPVKKSSAPVEKLPSSPDLPPPPVEKSRSAAPSEDLDFLEPDEVLPSVDEPPATVAETKEDVGSTEAPRSIQVEEQSGLPDYYLALLQRKIDRRWEPSSAGERGGPKVSCLVRFRIGASGAILSPRVIEGSGFSVFDREALRAVISASPLPPPPAGSEAGKVPINVRFHLER